MEVTLANPLPTGSTLPSRSPHQRADSAIDHARLIALLPLFGSGSGGSASHVVVQMARWSTPYVVVSCPRHPLKPVQAVGPVANASARVPRSTVDRLENMSAALSLNKAQLARVLNVTRPTVYHWLGGGEPERLGQDRIDRLDRLLDRAGVSATDPLNARFVRRGLIDTDSSLLDLLCNETLDEPTILEALDQVRKLDRASGDRRRAKEGHLQAAGFEAVDAERRRDQLATSIALRDWPR